MKLMFIIPGNIMSSTFFGCWNKTIKWCAEEKIEWAVSTAYSPYLYFVRSMALRADNRKGKFQKPFDKEIEYDYLMFLDTDQVWRPQQIKRLIEHDEKIVSGYYLMEGKEYTCCGIFDRDNYRNTRCFPEKELKSLPRNSKGLVDVHYNGFGFMLIKDGVFETIPYPWFEPVISPVADTHDLSGEDVGFCYKAREVGYKILVDPTIKVGHEKKIII